MSSNSTLTPPDNDPGDLPVVPCLINEAWSVVLVGLIQNTMHRDYWDIPDEDWELVSNRLDALIDILQNPD